MKQIEWAGICAICFWPVEVGKEFRLRPNGTTFCKKCVERYPDAYYLKRERVLVARSARKEGAKSEKG